MMGDFKLCGYKLAAQGLEVIWAHIPYEGYDRDYYYDPDFDLLRNDGSELWALQRAALVGDPYFQTIDEPSRLQAAFAKNGKMLDVIRSRVDADSLIDKAELEGMKEATDAGAAEFQFLGYDTGWLRGTHSIIYQPGFMDELDDSYRRRWSVRLNKHGLFHELEDCREFRELYHRLIRPKELVPMAVLEVAVMVRQNI